MYLLETIFKRIKTHLLLLCVFTTSPVASKKMLVLYISAELDMLNLYISYVSCQQNRVF